jgi:pimeloyl-ACP methyl ester carboxylesterase
MNEKTNLILLPGLDGTGQFFGPFLIALPFYLSPQVVSYPANEFLDYDALVEFVKERIPRDEPFVLLAESFSGPVALKLAAMKPRNLIALVLCATFVSNPTLFPSSIVPSWFYHLLFKFRLHGPELRYFLIGTDARRDVVDHFQQTIQTVAPDVLARRSKSVVSVDVRDELRACEKPILYLQAKRDKLVGKRCLQEILSLKPNVKSVEVDAPHFLLQRNPQRAVDAITDFLQTEKMGLVFER